MVDVDIEYNVTVIPGEGVQAAVDLCPPGGKVLLLPGTHDGPVSINRELELHGHGQAVLRAMGGLPALTSEAARAKVAGLIIEAAGSQYGVVIACGGLQIEKCDVVHAAAAGIDISGGSCPTISSCK